MRVDRLLHRVRHPVDTVPNARKVSAELLHEGDEFCDLLLGHQVDVEVELSPLFRVAALSILSNQNGRSHQKCNEAHDPLKPGERGRIECPYSKGGRDQIRGDPEGRETQKQIQGVRPPDLSRDPLDTPLVFTDMPLGASMQCRQRFYIFVAVVRSGLPFVQVRACAVPTVGSG
jgi:hypothetical protein